MCLLVQRRISLNLESLSALSLPHFLPMAQRIQTETLPRIPGRAHNLHLAPPNSSTLSNGLDDQGRKRLSVNLVF